MSHGSEDEWKDGMLQIDGADTWHINVFLFCPSKQFYWLCVQCALSAKFRAAANCATCLADGVRSRSRQQQEQQKEPKNVYGRIKNAKSLTIRSARMMTATTTTTTATIATKTMPWHLYVFVQWNAPHINQLSLANTQSHFFLRLPFVFVSVRN